jgi:hypothetical protein
MHSKPNTPVVLASKSRGVFLKRMIVVGAIVLTVGFCMSGVVKADGEVSLSPKEVAFPPQEFATLPLWDHMAEQPPDHRTYYCNVRGRDACELLAAIYGGRPSDYWAPGIREWTGAQWNSRPLIPGESLWKDYPSSYGVKGDDTTDHFYLTGNSVINLAAGEYQLGQGLIELGKYTPVVGNPITRESITIKGAGKDKTFLNGNYARDSLYAVWNDETGGVTVEIRDLAISSSVGSLGSVGFTLSNVKVEIPLMAYTNPQFGTFGFKHGAISVYIDNGYTPYQSIGDMTIKNCDFINDGYALLISAADYIVLSSRNLTITGNKSFTGLGGFLIVPSWDGTDGYTNKVVTKNYIEMRQSYLDEEVGGFEGIWCESSGSALIANNEIKFENNAPLVWGMEIGSWFPAIDVIVKNNRIYQTFTGTIGAVGADWWSGGGFGITLGGYWGGYTESHNNTSIGNNLSNFHPSLGTYYLGKNAYHNIIMGNAGMVGYDGEPSPIPNNFITGVTPMAGAPHIGPQIVDALKLKHDLLKPKAK